MNLCCPVCRRHMVFVEEVPGRKDVTLWKCSCCTMTAEFQGLGAAIKKYGHLPPPPEWRPPRALPLTKVVKWKPPVAVPLKDLAGEAKQQGS